MLDRCFSRVFLMGYVGEKIVLGIAVLFTGFVFTPWSELIAANKSYETEGPHMFLPDSSRSISDSIRGFVVDMMLGTGLGQSEGENAEYSLKIPGFCSCLEWIGGFEFHQVEVTLIVFAIRYCLGNHFYAAINGSLDKRECYLAALKVASFIPSFVTVKRILLSCASLIAGDSDQPDNIEIQNKINNISQN